MRSKAVTSVAAVFFKRYLYPKSSGTESLSVRGLDKQTRSFNLARLIRRLDAALMEVIYSAPVNDERASVHREIIRNTSLSPRFSFCRRTLAEVESCLITFEEKSRQLCQN